MCASGWVLKPRCRMKVKKVGSPAVMQGSTIGLSLGVYWGSTQEHTCWDPKDGELCLSRVKPEETLVEARSGSNVQIDHGTWA